MDEIIGANNRRALQVKRCRKDGWSKGRRKLFLDTLARTCNVKLSSAAAGMGAPSAYGLRGRDAAFAALWQEALACGYDRLEEALLGHALQGINDIVIADDACERFSPDTAAARDAGATPGPQGAVLLVDGNVRLALALLNRHRGAVEGTGSRGPRKVTAATTEATDAALRRKLAALGRKMKAQCPPEGQ